MTPNERVRAAAEAMETEMDEEIARAFEDIYAGRGTVYEAGEFARLADELEAADDNGPTMDR